MKKDSKREKYWTSVQLLFLAAITLGYVGAVMPVALTPAMIPALESDEDLNWGKKTSGLFLFSRSFFESCGLLTIGFLSDAYGGRRTLTTYELSAAMLLFLLASVHLHSVMFLSLIFISLLKGTALPATTNMIGLHLAPEQWDLSFVFVGCASRLGSSFTPMLLGFLLRSTEWEFAVPVIAVVAAVFCLAFNLLMDLKEEKSGHTSEARVKFWRSSRSSEESSMVLFATQLEGLLKDCDTWLILGTIVGSEFVFRFGEYTAIFSHSIYGASVSEAAAISSAYPSGQLCGLVVDAIILFLTGPGRGRRVLYVIAWFSTLLAFGVVLFLFMVPVNASWFATLAFVLGSLGVQISYVPIGVFAVNQANCGRSGSALSASILEGLVGMTTGSMCVYIAYIRSSWSEYSALKAVLLSMLIGLMVTIPSFTAYLWRNWNAPVLNPMENSDDCQDIEDDSSGSRSSTDAFTPTNSAVRRSSPESTRY
eukprot:gnl/MRDRNA2_/MRDRNA2_98757_c0_seq1.p1 gnl/MRDRNA2_/MRDRNA2_98757_c0~~gnl/MRDRNA2_/MRDRNA2_98757_c0_seq1.p1  ORF type:complete len:480 (-),score=57.80 gnl/MRDRNA2_/MRDRNA2_98757_c0_seq1:26-1465(-)